MKRTKPPYISSATGLPELAASAKGVGKTPTASTRLGNEWEYLVEMILKQMLKQARGDRRPDVRVGVGSPLPCEAPDFMRMLLNMLGDTDDRLPTKVDLSIGGFITGENALRFSYGAGDSHVFSQRSERSHAGPLELIGTGCSTGVGWREMLGVPFILALDTETQIL